MMLKKIKLFFLLIIFTPNAWGIFMMDPYLAQKVLGDVMLQGNKFNSKMFEVGSRFGIANSNSMLGIDASLLNTTFTSTETQAVENYTGLNYGFFLGHYFPYFHIWGNYIIESKLISETDQSKITGPGYEIAFGIGGFNSLNLFLKYQSIQYRERVDKNDFKFDLTNGNEIQTSIFFIGINIPLSSSGSTEAKKK